MDARLDIGDFSFDLARRQLLHAGREIHLEPRAFDTLAYLVERPGRLVEKRELLDALWPGLAVTDNALTRCIHEIRSALGDDPAAPRYIQTVPRLGYRFVAEPRVAAAEGQTSVQEEPARRRRQESRASRRRWLLFVTAVVGGLALAVSFLRLVAPGDSRGELSRPPRVAVLPFETIPAERAGVPIGELIAEHVLESLATVPEVDVIARRSSFAFASDSDADVRKIASALDASWLVDGSVRRTESGLIVTAQLIDARDGLEIWADRYEAGTHEERRISGDIARATLTRVAPSADTAVAAAPAVSSNPDADWQYRLGLKYLSERPAGWIVEALESFEAAIDLDENFAAAWAGRAIVLALGTTFMGHGASEQLAQARTAAGRSLELDPALALGHAALGLVLIYEEAGLQQIEAALQRAIDLDPTLVQARIWLASELNRHGHFTAAREQRAAALRQDPLNSLLVTNVALDLAARGRYDEARQLLEKLFALPRVPQGAYAQLARVHAAQGNLYEALRTASLEMDAEELPFKLYAMGRVAVLFAQLGEFAEANEWLDRATALDPQADLHVWRLNVLVREGRLTDAGRSIRERAATEGVPEPVPAFIAEWLGVGEFWSGNPAGAVQHLEPLWQQRSGRLAGGSDMVPDGFEIWQILALAFRQSGLEQSASDVLTVLLQEMEQQERSYPIRGSGFYYEKAACLASLGRTREAIDALQAAIDAGWNDYYRIRHDPRFEALRSIPRFEAAIARSLAAVEIERSRLAAGDPLPARIAHFDAHPPRAAAETP